MTTPPAPRLDYIASLIADVAPAIDLGLLPDGHQRLLPITGGRLTGPNVSGRVLEGGADHQYVRSATTTELDAFYAIEMDDGSRIAVHSIGLRVGSGSDIAALGRGEPVDPAKIYFRGSPRITSADPGWAWVNDTVFVGTGVRNPTGVELALFAVR